MTQRISVLLKITWSLGGYSMCKIFTVNGFLFSKDSYRKVSQDIHKIESWLY